MSSLALSGAGAGAARLRALPREARDTLFLLVVIGWTVLPHVATLPLWCSVFTAAVLLWRGVLAWGQRPLPPRWVVLGALAAVAVLTMWSHRTLLGKEAGITLVVAMMALKTLELRARRDALVVFFLGFFIVLTQFLHSQSMLIAFTTALSVWGLMTALVLANMPVGQPSLRRAAGLAGHTAVWGLPLMAVLFVLFPRVGPLWGVPQDGAAKTGLSANLRMGSIAEVALDDSIALRLRFLGTAPRPETLYFRGPVLAEFDGREWRRLEPSFPRSLQPKAELRVSGPPVDYEMTLEPQRVNILPLLEATPDTPASAPRVDGLRVGQRDDLQWQADRPVTERLRFRAQAWTAFRHGPVTPVVGLQDYIALPAGYNPRTLDWAARLRRDPRYAQADARTLAAAVLDSLTTGGYRYTLEPGTYGDDTGRHAVDEFWLDRKAGFCEHFATAFVVVMRALDVPSRVVTGYQGADLTPTDGYYVVRNSHAHAWAEYWQPGEGWVRADPTAAVAPERIGASRNLRAPAGLMAGALDRLSPTLVATLRSAWEAANNRWNQWVLGYSRGQQLELMKRLGFSSPDWEDLVSTLVVVLAAGGLLAGAWAAWQRHQQAPWSRLVTQVRAGLARLGVQAAPHDAPRTLAATVRARFGAQGEALASLLLDLDRARYGTGARSRPDPAWGRAFASQVRRLRGRRG